MLLPDLTTLFALLHVHFPPFWWWSRIQLYGVRSNATKQKDCKYMSGRFWRRKYFSEWCCKNAYHHSAAADKHPKFNRIDLISSDGNKSYDDTILVKTFHKISSSLHHSMVTMESS